MTGGATDGRTPRRTSLTTADGVELDARLQGPEQPESVVVWCHPHPLFGGSMFAPLMNAVADSLAGRGIGVLRFDFRGVGESGGEHGDGIAEVDDVRAAFDLAASLSDHVVVAGWSFGALVALRFVASSSPETPYVGVAPAIFDGKEFAGFDGGRSIFIVGERDRVVDNGVITDLAATSGAQLRAVDTDHFFVLKAIPVRDAILELTTASG